MNRREIIKHLTTGEKLYNTFCGTCHQQDGQGALGRFPPLVNTDWVLKDKQQLIALTLNGLQGQIEVQGETYHGVMPPHNFLPDEDIAEILTYIRQSWGNDATEVTEEEVSSLRGK